MMMKHFFRIITLGILAWHQISLFPGDERDILKKLVEKK